MTINQDEKPWALETLGDLTPKARSAFYDDLSDDDPKQHLWGDASDPKRFENPRLEVGILLDTGEIVSPGKHPNPTCLQNAKIDVYLERYFVQAMPGKEFDLQLAISSRHQFTDRPEAERVSHTLVVRGVLGDYANYLAEPVFENLSVSNKLLLDIGVTFLTDRSTERLMQFLKGPELRQGIKLASVYNPVFGTVATYVKGVVESLASARKNRGITDAHIGLLSSPGQLSPPLIEGTYIFLQPSTDPESFATIDARYDAPRQRVVVGDKPLERNYIILRIKKSEEQKPQEVKPAEVHTT